MAAKSLNTKYCLMGMNQIAVRFSPLLPWDQFLAYLEDKTKKSSIPGVRRPDIPLTRQNSSM